MDTTDIKLHTTLILEARAHRNLRQYLAAKLKDHNLTVMEWVLLGLVGDHSKSGVSVSDLARTLDVKTALTSVMVSKQVKAGLLSKIASSSDNRLRYVHLTEGGKIKITSIEQALEEGIRAWLKDVSDEAFDHYLEVVSVIAHNKTEEGD